MSNSRIITHTLGCKVNWTDTEAVREALAGHGLLAGKTDAAGVDSGDGASRIAIIGTCCVTAEGEKQSRKEVRRALRRVGPHGRVFVTGCAARLSPESFNAIAGNVDAVPGDPAEVAAAITARLNGGGSAACASEDGGAPGPGATPEAAATPKSGARTRYFLKVQDGCAGMCAYCIVPQVRGRPRSRPLAELAQEAARRVAAGYPEIVVSGINVGGWRDGDARLATLMAALAATPGLRRLRLSSIEVTDLDDELLELMAGRPLIGRHLHLPLQSGDDAVLAAMGRRYSREQFVAAARRAREALPGVNLTTDVIVGFPGESRSAFDNTVETVERVGFSKVHVFVYSPRPGTRAALAGDPVPAGEKKRRSRVLRGLSDRLGTEYRRRKLGRTSEILLESGPEHPGSAARSGYSSDYVRFTLTAPADAVMVKAVAEAVTGTGIRGKLVDSQ